MLSQLTHIVLQNSGSDRCAIMLWEPKGDIQVRAIATLETIDLCPIALREHSFTRSAHSLR
ncbi:MAG: hypothetical protein HC800_00100 [Phormidesmis sp. RL_2_1]|nr:hypothetical protein [Phormidesmis sp. RL_2_1]